jgi:hypothetical protein
MAALEFSDSFRLDIEPDRRVMPAEFGGERQTNVAKADNADFQVVDVEV